MDQESGAASSAGSFISLTEHEQRLYSALHGRCQADAAGKLSSGKVAELFKASQLPPEALHKVTEVCGAKRLGYFGTPQFFVALKLLAAAQSGLPVRLESVTANLPLPRFVGLKSEPEMRYATLPASIEGPGAQCGAAPAAVSWTPADRSTSRHPEANVEKKEPRSPPRSPCSSPAHSPLTYRSYPYAKPKDGADSQMTYESKQSPRPIAKLEQQHSSPMNYGTKAPAEHPAMARASSAERLAQQGAGDSPGDDPWRITEEQLEYYTNQFRSLQPDLGALILGAVAKHFFTKSKLPIPELSHIWELSDVDRDGALTFSEFCTAFHLIVARKNGYPLPESLPPSLQPGFTQQEEDIPDTPEDRSIIERIQPSLATTKQDLKEESCKKAALACTHTVKRKTRTSKVYTIVPPDHFRKEKKRGGDMLGDNASLTRMTTPQRKQTLQLGAFPERPEPPQHLDPQMRTKTRPRSYSSTSIEDAMKKAEEPPTPPPRPQKSHSRASSLDLNKLFQQGAPGVKSGWPLPPPALPPRPSTSQVSHFINASEKTPPNKVQQPNFADFSHFREEEESCVKPEEPGPRSRFGPSTEDLTNASKQDVCPSQAPQKPVRRKYHPESQNPEAAPPPAASFPPTAKPAQKLLSGQKREIQMAIRKNKESNAVLTRLNSELQQQLKVVHQERVTLESQLEPLRPLAST
ncbi:ralBP1-associated Eps domain-containing protein 2 isoform X2 [Scophthalmus maximus]|uniref:ralBP1-associated Eps domain-containing protein 2 isoform X2 n=1 Tax=Scophthalmus maximus TaxID=52904 RepID=UPI0015E05FCF|nr:ralBP1-associated Eps domain-containing protein 2 isoform X2 [Scophthalmus maximus]